MENQAGLNRFAEADFIGKQNSWRQPLGHFRRNIELMGNEIDSASYKATDFGLAALELMIERFHSKVEHVGRVHDSGEQPFIGLVEHDAVVEFGLAQRANATASFAVIEDQPIAFGDGLHDQRDILAASNSGANLESHAAQWCVITGVLARRVARLEFNGHGSSVDLQHGP